MTFTAAMNMARTVKVAVGRVPHRQRFSPLLTSKPNPEQVEKARAAMDAIHRVCARCEHCTPVGICTCPASDMFGQFVQSMSRCICWAERQEIHGDSGLLGRRL